MKILDRYNYYSDGVFRETDGDYIKVKDLKKYLLSFDSIDEIKETMEYIIEVNNL